MKDQPVLNLQRHVSKAAAVRAMCQTDGFKIVQKTFEEQTQKVTKKFLDPDTTPEQALQLRHKVQVWIELQKMLSKILLTGKISALNLSKLDADFPKSPIDYGQGDKK
jgi:predicted naringenin-chalcone synthase